MHALQVNGWSGILAITLLSCVSPCVSTAQEAGDQASFRQKADRLERIVLRRPRRGTALDLWIQHYEDAGRRDDLVRLLASRVKSDPDDATLQLAWGLVCQRVQQRDAALEAFRRARELTPKEYYPRMLLAEELLRQQRTVDAATELAAAIQLELPRQDYLSIAKQLAVAYQRTGEPEKAREVWEQISQRFASDVPVLAELATQLQNEGESASALRLWNSIQQQSTDDPFQQFTAAVQISQLYLQSDEHQLAVQQLEPLLDQVVPDSWRAETVGALLERALLSQGGPPQLVAFWSARLKKHPQDLTTMIRLAGALSRANRSMEAEDVYKQAITKAPQRRALYDGLIAMYVSRGDFAAAIEQAERLAEALPKDAETWLQLGRLYLQQDASSDDTAKRRAIDAWKKLAAIRPTDASLAMQVATACLEAAIPRQPSAPGGQPNEIPPALRQREALLLSTAESYLREAIQRDPAAAQYREYLAELLYQLDRREEAVETCRQLAHDGPPATWHEVARLLARFGYVDEAIDAAQRAVAGTTQDLGHREQYLRLLSRAGRHAQAREQLNEWVEHDTNDEWLESAVQLRVDLAMTAGDISQEVERLRHYAKSHPQDSRALWTTALLLAAAGQPIEAAEAMSRAVERQPNHAAMIRQLANLLELANRPELAVEQYRRLVSLDPSRRRDDYQRVIDLELRQNHLPAAEEAAKQLVQIAPTDPESHLLRATVAMRRGDLETRLASLRRAVQVAPRDLQMRRQYATGLRDSRQMQAALDEAFSCFELAESLAEKRSILSWTLDWNAGLPERKWLLQKVRQARQQQSDIYNSTLSLVHLLDRMNRQEEALRELTDLQRQFPADVNVLEDLVRLAEATHQSDVAVKYQEQLARFHPSAEALEHLARLYRQDGQLDAAAQIWDDLLNNTGSYDQTVAMVDRLLNQGDVYQAQRFAEAGLAKFPDNWQLAYRSGLIHLALSQPAAAREALGLVLYAKPPQQEPTAVSPSTPAEYHAMDAALRAHELFRAIGYRIERHGARNPKTIRQFFDATLMKAGGSGSLADTRVYSAVALLTLAYSIDEPAAWIAELLSDPGASASQLSLAAISAWVSYRGDECRQLIARLRLASPETALPSLMSLLNPPYWDAEDGISVQQLQTDFQWLREHRPRLARDTRSMYIARLFHHPDQAQVTQLTKQSLAAAADFSDVTSLMPLVRRAKSAQLSAAFIAAVDKLLPRNASRIDKNRVWSTLTFCLTSADWNQEQQSKVTLDLLEMMLSRSRLSVLSRQSGVFQLATDPYAKVIRRVTKDVALLNSQRRFERRSNQPQAIREQQQQRVAWTGQQQRVLQSHNAGAFQLDREMFYLSPPPVVGRDDPRWFPTATMELDRTRLELLKQITVRLAATEQLPLLLNRLRAAEKTSDGSDRRAFQLAPIVVAWYAGQYQSALDQLSDLAQARPDEADLPLLLVRAHLQQGRLPDALAALNRIQARTDDWLLLRRALAADWSAQALVGNLEGHTGAIASLAFSVDGRKLASASIDQTVRVWDVSTGKLDHTLSGHDDMVLAVAYSPAGNVLASGGYDRKVRLWDAETLEAMGSLDDHTSAIRALAFSADGQRLATAGDDRVVYIWDVATGQRVGKLEGHRASVTALAFSPSGTELASGSNDRTIRIWNTRSGEQLDALGSNDGSIRSVIYSTSDDHLVAGCDGRVYYSWTRNDGQWSAQTIQTAAGVRSLSYDAAGQRLATGLDDNSVIVRDAETAREQLILRGHTGRVLTVSFSPDGRSIASAGFDGVIKLWNAQPSQQ